MSEIRKLTVNATDQLVADLPAAPAKKLRIRARKDGSHREQRSIVKVRNALAKMLEDNAPMYHDWFVQAAAKDPIKALILMKDLAEYFLPKLGRIEQVGEVTHKVAHFVAVTDREKAPAAIEGDFVEVKK